MLLTSSMEVLIIFIGRGETQEMCGIIINGSLVKPFDIDSNCVV